MPKNYDNPKIICIFTMSGTGSTLRLPPRPTQAVKRAGVIRPCAQFNPFEFFAYVKNLCTIWGTIQCASGLVMVRGQQCRPQCRESGADTHWNNCNMFQRVQTTMWTRHIALKHSIEKNI